MCGQTHRRTQRRSRLWQFESLIWGISSGFLWPVIFLCLVLSPYLVYLRVLPYGCAHLLAKMDFSEEGFGQVDITPFLTSKEAFCACIAGKVSSTSRMRNMWSLSFIWAGLFSRSCYFGISVHRGQTPAAQPGAHLSPASLGIDCWGVYTFSRFPNKCGIFSYNPGAVLCPSYDKSSQPPRPVTVCCSPPPRGGLITQQGRHSTKACVCRVLSRKGG